MGTRGPVAMPDNVRTLRGMKPLKTAGPDGTPVKAKRLVLPPKMPKPPEGLSPAARGEWSRVGRELERAGVLAEVDRGVLTAYCTAWAHMMEANKALQDGGLVRTRDGELVKHPAWQVYREANGVLVRCAMQLYLTPTARLRIPVAQGAKVSDDDGADLFD